MYEKFLKQITDFIFIDQEPQKADIIFIPGNGFPNPSERAAELYREEFAKKLLPSGHYSVVLGHFAGVLQKQELYQGKFETEWEFLQQVLVQNGVDKKDILKEDNATYTYENAIYSKKVTDKEGMKVKKAILCCMPYHARRALLYYQLLYPETEFFVCPAKESPITAENWYLSKEGIETVLGEVERCGSQFHEILNEIKKEVRS